MERKRKIDGTDNSERAVYHNMNNANWPFESNFSFVDDVHVVEGNSIGEHREEKQESVRRSNQPTILLKKNTLGYKTLS